VLDLHPDHVEVVLALEAALGETLEELVLGLEEADSPLELLLAKAKLSPHVPPTFPPGSPHVPPTFPPRSPQVPPKILAEKIPRKVI
jgi:hypothetical protein